MKEQLSALERKALQELERIKDLPALEQFRIAYLGKKGQLTTVLKQLGTLSAEERPAIGKRANQIKEAVTRAFDKKEQSLHSQTVKMPSGLDVTLPGREPVRGHLHPLTLAMQEVCAIFTRMGFRIVEGPNVELDYYNFEALNIPKDHSARDMQDTFYITDNIVLRTHTSPMQVRVMESQAPPVSIIAPGKTYRHDSPDASHSPMFHQVEGLLVDKDVSLGDLKGTLTGFVHQMFGADTSLRFRPSYFPFTEPSAEVDIRCVICKGKGCRTCANTGWLEILGSGMVNPAVYGFVHYDPEVYSGYAFGIGIERIAMLKYGIDDMQLFYKNDMRFLKQF